MLEFKSQNKETDVHPRDAFLTDLDCVVGAAKARYLDLRKWIDNHADDEFDLLKCAKIDLEDFDAAT